MVNNFIIGRPNTGNTIQVHSKTTKNSPTNSNSKGLRPRTSGNKDNQNQTQATTASTQYRQGQTKSLQEESVKRLI